MTDGGVLFATHHGDAVFHAKLFKFVQAAMERFRLGKPIIQHMPLLVVKPVVLRSATEFGAQEPVFCFGDP